MLMTPQKYFILYMIDTQDNKDANNRPHIETIIVYVTRIGRVMQEAELIK